MTIKNSHPTRSLSGYDNKEIVSEAPIAAVRREDGMWFVVDSPVKILSATTVSAVTGCLTEVNRYIDEGFFAAGFVSYEAAPAFDQAFACFPPDDFPLAWFVLCRKFRLVSKVQYAASLIQDIDWTPSVSKLAYFDAYNRIRECLERGEAYQVNYTLRMKASFTAVPWDYFCTIAGNHPMPYAAFINTGRYKICSFSPELFFRIDGEKMTSQPMKGTSKRGRYFGEDDRLGMQLMRSMKERAENVMITDMIRNDMGRFAKTGTITVPELCTVKKFGTVLQMISTVMCTTDTSLPDIIKALFPCASVTGAPKIRATEIIAELEDTPRHVYCGAIGWCGPGRKACFNVGIRTVIVDMLHKKAEYGIGSGIVWDGTMEHEYEECMLKAKMLGRYDAPFLLVESLLYEPFKGYYLIDEHMKRLASSADYFQFKVNIDKIRDELFSYAASEGLSRSKVRLIVDASGDTSITFSAVESEAVTMSKIITVKLADAPVDSSDYFLFHKTTKREQYSGIRDRIQDCDDLLFFNQNGELTETMAGNIVLEIDGDYSTPPVECGLLCGVFREWLIRSNAIKENVLKKEDLFSASRIYRINSVRKWQSCRLL